MYLGPRSDFLFLAGAKIEIVLTILLYTNCAQAVIVSAFAVRSIMGALFESEEGGGHVCMADPGRRFG